MQIVHPANVFSHVSFRIKTAKAFADLNDMSWRHPGDNKKETNHRAPIGFPNSQSTFLLLPPHFL